MTAPLLADTIRTIQAQQILHAVKPQRCPAPRCRAFYDAAVASMCEYHQHVANNPGVCQRTGCDTYTPTRDFYGMCPEHKVPRARGSRTRAVMEIGHVYPATIPQAPERAGTPHMVITPQELRDAQRMLDDLDAHALSMLLGERQSFPKRPGWQAKEGSYSMPTYMAGVAVAVARGRYTLQEDQHR